MRPIIIRHALALAALLCLLAPPASAADVTITAANVLPTSSTVQNSNYTAGATITAGQVVYLDSSNLWQLAKADTATHSGYGTSGAVPVGIALCNAAASQPIFVAVSGSVTIGGTVVVGTSYVVSGANAGGVAPAADLTTGQYVTVLGTATTTGKIQVNIQVLNVTHARLTLPSYDGTALCQLKPPPDDRQGRRATPDAWHRQERFRLIAC